MVRVQPKGQGCEFEIWTESPCIYLDHWALRRFSENHVYGDRFLSAFERRGTVMFSVMNAAEIAGDTSAQGAPEIREFLEKLGPHWFPMTIDPLRIIDAEETGTMPDGVPSCASVEFLTDSRFAVRGSPRGWACVSRACR